MATVKKTDIIRMGINVLGQAEEVAGGGNAELAYSLSNIGKAYAALADSLGSGTLATKAGIDW